MLILFLLFTLMFLVAGICILRIFMDMIQPGAALDIVFNWQKMLSRLYGGNKRQQLLGKALGDCAQCTSFWFMPLWFLCYYITCQLVLNFWVSDVVDTFFGGVFISWVWYAVFHSLGAFFGFLNLRK